MWMRAWPVLMWMVAVAVVLAGRAPHAMVTLLLDGAPAVALILAAVGYGVWPAERLLRSGCTRLQLACLACALGLGALALITLGLGLGGLLIRPVAIGLLIGGLVAGTAYVRREHQRGDIRSRDREGAGRGGRAIRPLADARGSDPIAPTYCPSAIATDRPPAAVIAAAVAVLVIPVVVLLYAASLPPGLLWESEARGYDVLEYHLQGPREYYEAGRITFLAHNVYMSFPQQMEMLYLLLMHVLGNAYAAAVPAQLLSAALAIFAVVAIAAWAPAGWPRVVGLLVGGGVPWLVILGSLAYVESGMLFFAAVAAGLLVSDRGQHGPGDWATLDGTGRRVSRGVVIAAGICAGLAGGCKYTALALVTAALPVAWLLATFVIRRAPDHGATPPDAGKGAVASSQRRRGPANHGGAPTDPRLRFGLGLGGAPASVGLFALAALLAFSPWLVRNVAQTGNPVYPFAYAVFGGRDWSASQDAQWARGHRVAAAESGIGGQIRIGAHELFGDLSVKNGGYASGFFGVGLLPLAVFGAVRARSRGALVCACWLGAILVFWSVLTHMPGRFVTPIVVPGVMLAAMATARSAALGRWLLLGFATATCVAGGIQSWSLLRKHEAWWAARQVDVRALPGQTRALRNAVLPERVVARDAYLWLIGDAAAFYYDCRVHYTVVLSRDPGVVFAAENARPEACVDWLRERGVTHVLFAWSEIERLRGTYGFSPVVTRAWVAGLESAGLRRVSGNDVSGRVLYEVKAR
jgi:hypothetical protein